MKEIKEGIRDSIPIALGYFAVSFALGINMKSAGINAAEGTLMSATNLASAGQYALIQVIADHGTVLETAAVAFITNIRYFLMSASLSQKIDEKTSTAMRAAIAFAVTDELFAISSIRSGKLNPRYTLPSYVLPIVFWSLGTCIGILSGQIFPENVTAALSVSLYGMFLAIIIPPAGKDRVIAVLVIAGFITSALMEAFVPVNNGTRIILLTVILASIAAILHPIKEKEL